MPASLRPETNQEAGNRDRAGDRYATSLHGKNRNKDHQRTEGECGCAWLP